MAARPRAKTAETKVTGPAFYLGIWQSCVALAMLWPEAALVSRETQGMLKLAGGLVMSFFRQLPPVIQTQLSPFYGKRLFFAKLAEIAYQYVLQEKKLTAPSLPSPDVLKEAMAKVKSATEEAIKEGRRILPPHAEIFDAAKGKIAKPLLQKYPSLPPEMVEYLAWNLSLSFLPRAVLSNKAIDALTPVIEAAFQQAGIAIPPGEQAQSLATELIKELNPEIEDYKKVPVGEMVIAGQARVLPPEAVPPPPAAEVISQAIRRANPDLVQPEKIEQIEFLARQAFREIRGRPPTELTFYLRQKVLEILPGVTPAQARKIAREAIGAVAVQESASVVPTEINVLTGGKSFPVPLTLTKPKEKGVLTAYDEARKRVKNLIEKNAAIGKVLASSPAFVDNFAFLLPEVSRTEVKSLPPDKVVPDAQDACALAAASLAITNPELEISFAAIKKMIKDVVVTQEDVSAIKEMMIIPAQARVSPAERRPIPKEVPLGQVHGGQPPSLFGFISRIVSETMRQNPLRAFRQPDELARKIKAILTTKGLNSRTALPIRRFLAEGISRFLGSQGVKPADINETLARANLGKEHPLFRFYKDVEPLLGEFQKRLSWFKSQLGTILPLLRKPVFPAPVGIKGGLWQSFWEGLQVGFWRTNISRFVRDEAGEIYIYNRPLGFVSSLSQPVFRSLASWFSKTALGKSINLGWRNLRQAGLNFLLQVGKSGLGQAVKKGLVFVAERLALTKLAATIGTFLGGPVGTAIGAVGGFLLDTAKSLLKKAVNFLQGKGLFSFFEKAFFGRGLKGQSGYLVESLNKVFGIITGMVIVLLPFLLSLIAFVFIALTALRLFFSIITAGAFIISKVKTIAGGPGKTPFALPLRPESQLFKLLSAAAARNCVPLSYLLATAQMETQKILLFSDTITYYYSNKNPDGSPSPARWWENEGCTLYPAKPGACSLGYCYDTCAAISPNPCPQTTVVGPMQLEQITWGNIMPGHDLMERCQLDLAIEAAAKKIKADSGTKPNECDWSKREKDAEETLVRNTARAYCGSCGTSECGARPTASCLEGARGCGVNYCEAILALYKQYEKELAKLTPAP